MEKHIYTVGEITTSIRENLENYFPEVWVEGEISNKRIPFSGHMYFTLKDEKAQLKCVMFKLLNRFLKFELEDGLQVIAKGKITVYEKRGDYQLVVEELQPKGRGALQLAFEQLKKKLEKEGLYLPEHKKKIPLLPGRIGIVTSPTGAAIRDILNIVTRRASRIEILINPVRVQGKGAAEEIAEAIDELDEIGNLDVLIVGRGGGSIEDLWAFNEEIVARSIFRCRTPIISAVGHEIDYTISDFVADLRAPTPSAAAELVIAESEKLYEKVSTHMSRITHFVSSEILRFSERLDFLKRSHGFRGFEDRLIQYSQQVDDYRLLLEKRIVHLIESLGKTLDSLDGKLESLNPESVLRRGYSLTFKLPEKKIIRDTAEINIDDRVEVKLKKGFFISRVEEKHGDRNGKEN